MQGHDHRAHVHVTGGQSESLVRRLAVLHQLLSPAHHCLVRIDRVSVLTAPGLGWNLRALIAEGLKEGELDPSDPDQVAVQKTVQLFQDDAPLFAASYLEL